MTLLAACASRVRWSSRTMISCAQLRFGFYGAGVSVATRTGSNLMQFRTEMARRRRADERAIDQKTGLLCCVCRRYTELRTNNLNCTVPLQNTGERFITSARSPSRTPVRLITFARSLKKAYRCKQAICSNYIS